MFKHIGTRLKTLKTRPVRCVVCKDQVRSNLNAVNLLLTQLMYRPALEITLTVILIIVILIQQKRL